MYADTNECDGKTHVDTSCMFLTKSAFRVLPIWAMMPTQLGALGDRVMWHAIVKQGYLTAHDPQPTVAFRTQYQNHYQAIGEQPPPGLKTFTNSTGAAMRWWNSLPEGERNAWLARMGVSASLIAFEPSLTRSKSKKPKASCRLTLRGWKNI